MSGFIKGFDPTKKVHAYLILSPAILSSREQATKVAKAIMCTSPLPSGEPCGACSACRKTDAGTHPDVIIIGRENVKIKDLRETLMQAYLAPNESDSKVFILENIDSFSAQQHTNVLMQNVLLKILEEPPSGVYFVLTASSKNGVIPTVLSRVCLLTDEVKDISYYEDIAANTLPSGTAYEKSLLASYLEEYECEITPGDAETVTAAFDTAYGYFTGKDKNIFLSLQKAAKTRDDAEIYLKVMMLTAHSVLMYKLTGDEKFTLDFSDELKSTCPHISAKRAMASYELFEKAYLSLEDNANMNALTAYLSQMA